MQAISQARAAALNHIQNRPTTSPSAPQTQSRFTIADLMEAHRKVGKGWHGFAGRTYASLERNGNSATGAAQVSNVQGTSADEMLVTTTGSGNDNLTTNGGGGNDLIIQRAGRGRNNLSVTTGNGNDVVWQEDEGDGTFRVFEGRTRASTGAGNDLIRQSGSGGFVEAFAGDGDDQVQTRAGERGTIITQDGGRGNDELTLTGGFTPDSQLGDYGRQVGGEGSDRLTAFGEARKLTLNQQGGAGRDELSVFGNKSGGGANIGQNGGDDHDLLTFNGQGSHDVVHQSGGEGSDGLQVNSYGAGNRINQDGGNGDDDLRLIGSPIGSSDPSGALPDANFFTQHGGAGNDNITIDGGAGFNNISVFGGEGDDVINYAARGGDNVHLMGGEGYDRANIDTFYRESFDIVGDDGKVLYKHRGDGHSSEVTRIDVREMESIRLTERGETVWSYDKPRRTRRTSRFV